MNEGLLKIKFEKYQEMLVSNYNKFRAQQKPI